MFHIIALLLFCSASRLLTIYKGGTVGQRLFRKAGKVGFNAEPALSQSFPL